MKCLVINLDRSKDRLENATALFRGAGLPFERVPAVDGRALSPAERRAACPPVRFWISNSHRVLPCEIGCALSHVKAWKQAFADGSPVAAIFEDDIDFDPPGLRAALAAVEEENDPALPTVWLLHRGIPRPADTSGRRWFDLLETDDVGRSFCAIAYVLNAAAARRAEKLLTPMANNSDSWSMYARCGIRVLAAAEPCAFTHRGPSTIGYRRSSRWGRAWYRRFHWFRWRLAFRLDLFLKRLEGKRFPLPSPSPAPPRGAASP